MASLRRFSSRSISSRMRWRSIWTGAFTDMRSRVPPRRRRRRGEDALPHGSAPRCGAGAAGPVASLQLRSCTRTPSSTPATGRATSAASSASSRRSTRSPGSPTSRSTRSSTAARSRPASPSPRAATSWPCATRGSSTRCSTSRSCARCRASMAVGHVRYSTTGANSWENSQPVWRADRREVALGHNGNLINAVELHGELRGRGVGFRSTSDSEMHRRAALDARGGHDRGRGGRRDGARRGRLLDGRDDQGPRGRVPRSGRAAAAVARHARRPLLRRVGDLRVRHHRRASSCATSSRARSCR